MFPRKLYKRKSVVAVVCMSLVIFYTVINGFSAFHTTVVVSKSMDRIQGGKFQIKNSVHSVQGQVQGKTVLVQLHANDSLTHGKRNASLESRRMPINSTILKPPASRATKVPPTSDILKSYTSWGVKITAHQNIGALQLIVDHQEEQLYQKISKQSRNSFQNPHVFIQYPHFNVTVPRFGSEEDKVRFLAVPDYQAFLEGQTDPRLLEGLIELIIEGSASEKYDCGWPTKPDTWREPPTRFTNHLDRKELVVPLLVPEASTFQHFVDGVLPKLAQMFQFVPNHSLRYLIRWPRDQAVLEMLSLMDIKESQIIHYNDSSELVLIRHQLNTCKTPPVHPILWQQMRRMLHVTENLPTSFSEASVILLTRTRAYNGGRSMLNYDQVNDMLLKRYGDNLVVYDGGYNLWNTMKLFRNARMIVGVHGGAFYNLLFSPQQTVIVELLAMTEAGEPSPTGIAHAIVWVMSSLVGQTYYRILEHPGSELGDLYVSMDKLLRVLDEVDNRHGVSPTAHTFTNSSKHQTPSSYKRSQDKDLNPQPVHFQQHLQVKSSSKDHFANDTAAARENVYKYKQTERFVQTAGSSARRKANSRRRAFKQAKKTSQRT